MRKLPIDPYFLVGLASALVLGGVFLMRSNPGPVTTGPTVLEDRLLERARALGVHSRTGTSGVLEVVEITDLQCPACAAADRTLAPLLASLVAEGRIIRTVYDAPLTNHRTAIPASVAFGCADTAAPERRSAFRSQVYARQTEWVDAYPPEAALLSIAHEVGLGTARIRECIQSDGSERGKQFREARGLFSDAGLDYVPVFAVDGRIVAWTELEATLRRELAYGD